MAVKLILAGLALSAISYSAVPLFASDRIEGTCCSDDTQCPTAHHCAFSPGDDCSSSRTGYCVPVPR